MSIYSEIINEFGFDPGAPGPRMEPWVPWSVRGAMEQLTGRSDVTNWTKEQGQQLRRMVAVGDTTVEIPAAVAEKIDRLQNHSSPEQEV